MYRHAQPICLFLQFEWRTNKIGIKKSIAGRTYETGRFVVTSETYVHRDFVAWELQIFVQDK